MVCFNLDVLVNFHHACCDHLKVSDAEIGYSIKMIVWCQRLSNNHRPLPTLLIELGHRKAKKHKSQSYVLKARLHTTFQLFDACIFNC